MKKTEEIKVCPTKLCPLFKYWCQKEECVLWVKEKCTLSQSVGGGE